MSVGKNIVVFVTVLCSVSWVGSVFAREGVELGGGASYYLYDDTPLEDDIGLKLIGGYRFDNPWSIDINHARLETELEGLDVSSDFTHTYLDALYHFNSGGKIEPYLAFGGGQVETDIDGLGSDDETAYGIGTGLKYYLNNAAFIRPDVHLIKIEGVEGLDVAISFTISYLFGGKTSAPPPVSKPVEVKVKVSDSDGDGVADSSDECLATPAGVAVNTRGCPLDSDADGVYDYQDSCSGTDVGLKVDSKGCPVVLKETVSINLAVNFSTNSDVVEQRYYGEIRRVSDFLKQYQKTVAVIEGHTDTRGSADYNKDLSQRRADAVAAVLVSEFDIPAERVTAIGYGEQNPIADDSTLEGRLANRRVVGKISTETERMETR